MKTFEHLKNLILNKTKNLSALIYISFANISTAFAGVTVPESMKQAMKGDSQTPGLLNLIISLMIVIGLIYLTGWVYQKLNKINREKLANADEPDRNTFKVVSSLPMGQQKNLYAVEINNKILVIGSTAQNLSLLKEFDKNEKNNEQTAQLKTVDEEAARKDEKAEGLELIYKKYRD